ncbi:hypothetical protein [Arcanobacterium hippocoleae]|uniref:hypothetical protein n=1 Tax=Arcanobacterium hippocoleae TaxID=149017 RepID=UPI00334189E1
MTDLHKVVVLARGLGTRMRKAAAGAELTGAQAEAASLGAKAMMPIGRPFLDHCLHAYADAGITEACLVIGPEHQGCGIIMIHCKLLASKFRMRSRKSR